jgi:dTDP-glucose 4,6-dehydratase
MLITAWSRTYNLDYIIIRPTNNYGIGQYTEKLIPKTCKYLTLDRKIPLHNEGEPIRTWLHADDTAEACIKIIESNIRNEIFNICGNVEQKNIDTVSKIIRAYYEDDKINILDYVDLSFTRKGQDIRYSVNDLKLKSLGWAHQKKFDIEIGNVVKYYKDNFIW